MKFKRPTPEEAMARMHLDIEESKRIIEALMQYDLLDEDGYPTNEALHIVEEWHWTDPKGWFDFINSIWHMKSYGWHEGIDDHEFQKDTKVYRYNISTIGWSGNESIISSMQKNERMWFLSWVESRRGGHYIFELGEISE